MTDLNTNEIHDNVFDALAYLEAVIRGDEEAARCIIALANPAGLISALAALAVNGHVFAPTVEGRPMTQAEWVGWLRKLAEAEIEAE